ncbi:MAG: M28 family peptidase [Bacteroidetes bacterium]|nr:M28 family peptidase [Bacteroidota bacterium]
MRVNTFPGAMTVKSGERVLIPGEDYLVKASSAGIHGSFPLVFVSLDMLQTDSAFDALKAMNLRRSLVVLDTMSFDKEHIDKRYKFIEHNGLRSAGVVIQSKRRLIWTVARNQATYFSLEIKPGALSRKDSILSLDVDAKFVNRFKARNVWGMVKGTEFPDSFLVVTAHYDHLGMMGENTRFPGANDNASGTSMMLDLARYYANHPQKLSMVFIAFAAEEAGLVGSKYYTEHPAFTLDNIRFLLNLDLLGTGQEGITAVNATLFESEFDLLKELNDKGGYLPKVVRRGKAANSDHYWFSEKGVHCFFIYQMGSYDHYHDTGDKPELLPMVGYQNTIKLVEDFFSALQKSN